MALNVENQDSPIDDEYTALDKLNPGWNSNSSHELQLWPDRPPIIEITYYHGHYGASQSHRSFVITDRIKDLLINEGYVIGEPHWGYRSKYEFVLTERGEKRHTELWRERQEAKKDDNTLRSETQDT